jgi:hypothetical protein
MDYKSADQSRTVKAPFTENFKFIQVDTYCPATHISDRIKDKMIRKHPSHRLQGVEGFGPSIDITRRVLFTNGLDFH